MECEKLLPIERTLNLFEIFELEPGFELDVADLERKYKKMQMRLHPDRFATKDQRVSCHFICVWFVTLMC